MSPPSSSSLLSFIMLVIMMTMQVDSKPDVSFPTVSPEFLDLHYLPQESCKCGEPEPCPPVFVNLKRERATLVKGSGKYGGVTLVDLLREQIREVPSHSIVYSETEVIELQKIPEPQFQNVTLQRQVYEEEIEYFEVWIPKVEINYIYRDIHVYPEVEEPVAVPTVKKEDLPLFVTHRPVHFNESTFEVALKQEFLVTTRGEPLDVEEKMEVLEEKIQRKDATVQCESLRYVRVECYPPGQKIVG